MIFWITTVEFRRNVAELRLASQLITRVRDRLSLA